MQTHPKKRIEIIVEALLVRRVLASLDAAHVTGYSVLPVIAGRGHEGVWSAEGQVGDAGQMQMVVCITDAANLDAVLEGVYRVLARQIGLVTVGDVAVVRSDRF